MNAQQKIHAWAWAAFSLAAMGLASFASLVLMGMSLMDKHKTTSAPGDFASVGPEAITRDIAAAWAAWLPFGLLVAALGWEMRRDLLLWLSAGAGRDWARGFFHRVFVACLLLLCAGPLFAAIGHWRERAPFFPTSAPTSDAR